MTQPPNGYRDAYGQPVEVEATTVTTYETTTATSTPSTSDTAKSQAQGVAKDAKGEAASVAQDAKGEAASVAQDAKEHGRHVVDTAKDEASDVVSHAKNEFFGLLGNAQSELNDQAAAQQTRLAEFMRTVTTEIEGILDPKKSDYKQGVVSDLAGQASTRVSGLTSYLENAQPADLVNEVSRFARRRPGTFLAATAIAGVLVGRFGRGLADEAREDSAQQGQQLVTRPVRQTTYVETTPAPGYIETDYTGVGSQTGGTYATGSQYPTTGTTGAAGQTTVLGDSDIYGRQDRS